MKRTARVLVTFAALALASPAFGQASYGGPGPSFSGPWAVPKDRSAISGDPRTMWNPDYFGNPAHGVVALMNRILVGPATATGQQYPPNPTTWVDTYWPNIMALSQVGAISSVGTLGISGAVRTSDYAAWIGSPSGGTQATNGFALNDTVGSSIATGVFGQSIRLAGTGITESAEFNSATDAATVVVDPYNAFPNGATVALNLTVGWPPTYLGTSSAAMNVGAAPGASFHKGIIFDNGALDTSVGAGGNGVAMEVARGMSIRWVNSGGGTDAEIYGDASGIHVGVSGAWTPADASGAGLAFTGVSANYTRIGNMIFAYAQLTYPVTASGASAVVNGFPINFPAANYGRQCNLTYVGAATPPAFILPAAASSSAFFLNATGTAITNANLSAATVVFNCIYPAS